MLYFLVKIRLNLIQSKRSISFHIFQSMYWKASESIRCFKLNDLTQVGPWRNDYLLCSSFFNKLHVIDVQGKQELWECWSGNIWVPKEIDVYFVSLNQNIFSSTIKYILDLGYSFVSFIHMHCRFDEKISLRQKVKKLLR